MLTVPLCLFSPKCPKESLPLTQRLPAYDFQDYSYFPSWSKAQQRILSSPLGFCLCQEKTQRFFWRSLHFARPLQKAADTESTKDIKLRQSWVIWDKMDTEHGAGEKKTVAMIVEWYNRLSVLGGGEINELRSWLLLSWNDVDTPSCSLWEFLKWEWAEFEWNL